MNKITIIGGTGSLGTKLIEYYTANGWQVRSLSRDIHKVSALRERYPDADFYLGDVCDQEVVERAVKGSDFVVNCAATKIVSFGETHVEEYIRVNLLGEQVVGRVCLKLNTPHLFISSDKCVEAVNLYGKTKAAAEDLAISLGGSVLRYGNVTESRGSVFHVWNKLASIGKQIRVRSPEPTRFFMTLKDAVALVDEAIHYDNSILVPYNLKAFSVWDVAEKIAERTDIGIVKEKLLPGEKQHEILLSHAEYAVRSSTSILLCSVYKGYENMSIPRSIFSSDTAQRMEPNDVLKRLGMTWK